MLKIYNSLSRSIEDFKPIDPPHVGMYTCGPTVYDYAHIGNFRTYTMADILLRTLEYNGYKVKYVMNLTDVGHLTGDNLGDADTGEDRMEKSAKKLGKSAWDVAEFYTEAFLKDFQRLNLKKPFVFCKATDHIKEQIVFVELLEKKGYTYKTSDGIYFDTSKFPDYGKLSNLDEIKEGARIEVNPEKKNPRDFALWKFSQKEQHRQMEWESPWGKGFPGWHIECSAMSVKYLGESFDIHTGGIDLSSTHHPNEIAQAEAATGRQFVKYWLHGAFILVDGKRMSKSLGNNYKVEDLIQKGFEPLALRYLYLQTHYRQETNFTFKALEGSQNALKHLRSIILEWDKPGEKGIEEFEEKFLDAINNDLNMPEALAIVWEMVHSKNSSAEKAASLFKMDEVLGLQLSVSQEVEVTQEVRTLVKEREDLRKQRRFHLADQIRHRIKKLGYDVIDEKNKKPKIVKI